MDALDWDDDEGLTLPCGIVPPAETRIRFLGVRAPAELVGPQLADGEQPPSTRRDSGPDQGDVGEEEGSPITSRPFDLGSEEEAPVTSRPSELAEEGDGPLTCRPSELAGEDDAPATSRSAAVDCEVGPDLDWDDDAEVTVSRPEPSGTSVPKAVPPARETEPSNFFPEEEEDATIRRRVDDLPREARALLQSWRQVDQDDEDVTERHRICDLPAEAQAVIAAARKKDSDPLIELGPVVELDLEAEARAALGSNPGEDTVVDSQPSGAARSAGNHPVMPPPSPRLGAGQDVDLSALEPDLLSVAELSPLVAEDDDLDYGTTPSPCAQRPSHLKSSVPPMALPERGHRSSARPGRTGAYVGLAVALALVVVGAWLWLTPRDGSLTVHLRTTDGSPASKAEIYIDGQKRCDTDPCLVRDLSPGTKTVKVIVPGWTMPQVAEVSLSAGAHQDVWIELPATQGIQAGCRQQGVVVVVDGVERGLLPTELLELEPGEHHLRFLAPGYRATERTIQVRPGEVLDLGEVALEPLPPTLTLELATTRAVVTLVSPDGQRRILKGPWPMDLELEPGHYQVVANRDGFHPFVRGVELGTSQPQRRVRVLLRPVRERDPYEGL